MQYIPKRIITIWINDKPIASAVQDRIIRHNIEGFEHKVVTLDNCYKESQYVRDCLSRSDVNGWVKAADYLRMYYLYELGGIYLDIDIAVLKPFDDEILSSHLFAGREENGFISNAVVGVERHHPLVKACMAAMESLDGSDDMVFENGMELWTRKLDDYGVFREAPHENGIFYKTSDPSLYKIYPSEFFFPYNHQTGVTEITGNSYTLHEFDKSWINK